MRTSLRALAPLVSLVLLAAPRPAQDLVAAGADGFLWAVDRDTANVTPIGASGVADLAGLSFAPDGSLWGLSGGAPPRLWRFDRTTAQASEVMAIDIGQLGWNEGALAFVSDGVALVAGASALFGSTLLRVDVVAQTSTQVGPIAAERDVSGLAMRAGGTLVGIDLGRQELVAIEPSDASLTTLAELPQPFVGASGVAVAGELAFYVRNAFGSDQKVLVRFDQASGDQLDVGTLAVPGPPIVGLAGHGSFLADDPSVSVGLGGQVQMRLDVPLLAQRPYLVLGSVSGTAPGVPIGGGVLPLNFDAYTAQTLLAPNAPPLLASFGLLDAGGAATATFVLGPGTLGPGFAGLEVAHAAVVIDVTPTLVSLAYFSVPLRLELTP